MGLFRFLFGWLFGPDPARDQLKQEQRGLKDQLKNQKISKKIAKEKLKEAKYNYKTKKVEDKIKKLTEEKQTLLDALGSAASNAIKATLAKKIESIVKDIENQEKKKEEYQKNIIRETQTVTALDKEKLAVLADEQRREILIEENIKKEGTAGAVDQYIHGGNESIEIQQEINTTKQAEAVEVNLAAREIAKEKQDETLVVELKVEEGALEEVKQAAKKGDNPAVLAGEAKVATQEKEEKQTIEKAA